MGSISVNKITMQALMLLQLHIYLHYINKGSSKFMDYFYNVIEMLYYVSPGITNTLVVT